MRQKLGFFAVANAIIERVSTMATRIKRQKIVYGAVFRVEHWRGDQMLTERVQENIVPNEFIDYALDVALSGGTQLSAWYLALFSDNHTPAAGDAYATPGYTEATGYDEATRPAWSEAGVSSQTITNTANKATFTMDGTNGTIYGCSLVSHNVKGDTAQSGAKLGPVAQFTGGAITGIVDDDVIKVYMTITGSNV